MHWCWLNNIHLWKVPWPWNPGYGSFQVTGHRSIGRIITSYLCSVVTMALSCTVFDIFWLATGVTESHRNWYHSIACLPMVVSNFVSKMNHFCDTCLENYCELETWLSGRWKWQQSIDDIWFHIHIGAIACTFCEMLCDIAANCNYKSVWHLPISVLSRAVARCKNE